MKRKKLIIALAAGVVVAGIAVYLLGTKEGKKELSRLKKTGAAIAGDFRELKKDLDANLKSLRKEAKKQALKESFRAAMNA